MKQYIGTKVVNAMPMTILDFNELLGHTYPEHEKNCDGYLVEYPDSKPNTEYYAGYISWSPKEQFEAAYTETENGFSFGLAIEAMRHGRKVSRHGWNGKGQFLFYVDGSTAKIERKIGMLYVPNLMPTFDYIEYAPHIDIFNAQGQIVPWLASQGDMLAMDWHIVE